MRSVHAQTASGKTAPRRAWRRRLAWLVTVALLFGMWGGGCATDSVQQRRVERYRPESGRRSPHEWGVAEPEAPASAPRSEDERDAAVEGGNEEARADVWAPVFRRGDRVSISLSGIPRPEERQAVIDDMGEVNLPFIGGISIEGMRPSQAKHAIERAYIDGGFYRDINVSIVSEKTEFFIRGEVRNPGRHVLRPGMTLTQAVAAAGGYGEYARPSRIQLIRGEEITEHDAGEIEAGAARDPRIEPGDTIIVGRRRFL